MKWCGVCAPDMVEKVDDAMRALFARSFLCIYVMVAVVVVVDL